MSRLFDSQMANLADYDCFSQVVFKDIESYKAMKGDEWYKQHLVGDHEKFADTRKSKMTVGWITEFVRDGEAVEGMRDCEEEKKEERVIGRGRGKRRRGEK